jgi:hypothetical protein
MASVLSGITGTDLPIASNLTRLGDPRKDFRWFGDTLEGKDAYTVKACCDLLSERRRRQNAAADCVRVMRNLLIDMVENEASLAHATQMSEAEKTRAMEARTHRRRELFGEAIAALQKPGGGQDATFKFPTERA